LSAEPPRYDVILATGVRRRNLALTSDQTRLDGVQIQCRLNLRGFYRLPWLGIFLRNFWAKRHGAALA